MMDIKRYPRETLTDKKGMVLVVALLLIAALVLLGTTAVMMSTTDMKISANNKTANMAFYAAEAGTEEARARMRANFTPATGATGYIDDPVSNHTNLTWSVSIGGAGLYTSIQSALSYTVSIVHQKNATNQILYWGDVNGDGIAERTPSPTSSTGIPNKNIYLVTSNGVATNANKTIEIEMTRLSPITVPGALYVESNTKVMGGAYIKGTDQCGGLNKPGIVSAGPASSPVVQAGNPIIEGTPAIQYSSSNMSVGTIISSLKDAANYPYDYTANHNDNDMHWGTPTAGIPPIGNPDQTAEHYPANCGAGPFNIVYYNMHGVNEVRLGAGTSGCGILIVDGNLQIDGGFNWFGAIVVSGSLSFTGGGPQGRNITGGVIVGNEVDASLDTVGGSTSIVYCSDAINNITENQPMKRLSWKEQGM